MKLSNLKNSIFANIMATQIYIVLIYFIFILPILFLINFFKPTTADIFFAFGWIYALLVPASSLALLIGTICELKNAKSSNYILELPKKYTNNIFYSILFWIGFGISILSIIFFVFSFIIVQLIILCLLLSK